MSKLTLTFNMDQPEDKKEAIRSLKATDLYLAVLDFFQETRKVWKYSDDKNEVLAAERWDEALRDCLENYSINIEEEID